MVNFKKTFSLLLLCLLSIGVWGSSSVYLFQGNDIVNVVDTVMFYDNGGPDGNYTSDVSGAVTFVPQPGQVIKMSFRNANTYWQTATGADDLDFFNGYSTSATDKILSLYGSKRNLDDLLSSSPDGAITVQFNPTRSLAGWAIVVTSHTPVPLSIAGIEAEATSANVMKGAENQQMLCLKVNVSGEFGQINLNGFKFSTAGTTTDADITQAAVYYTDTVSTFSTNNLFDTTQSASDIVFNGNYNIRKSGVYKFWLAYDVNPTAAANNTLSAQLSEVVYNATDTLRLFTQNPQSSRTVASGFSGEYTIGASSSADYATFSAAVSAMSGGIDGAVTFNVENGTYDEMILIPHIDGASSVNKITFKSVSGNYQDVTVQKSGYLPRPSGFGSSDDYGTLTVNGADYLTFEGISFVATSSQAKNVILVTNVSEHFTLKNCYVEAPYSSSYSTNVTGLKVLGKSVAYQNNNYTTIEGCTFKGGYAGVNINGTGNVSLPKQRGATIRGNTFKEQHFFGVYLTKEIGGVVENNLIEVYGNIQSGTKPIDAVMMGNTIIRNNKIHLDSTATNYISAIYLRRRDANETTQGRNLVCNNEVIFNNPRYAGSYTIELTDPITNTDIVHNSLYFKHDNPNINPTMVRLKTYSSGKENESVLFANNILVNEAQGAFYRVVNEDNLNGLTFHNNAYYTTAQNLFAYNSSNTVASFSDWQTLAGDSASIVEQPQFVSESSLDLTAAGGMNMGVPLAYVPTDINGATRSQTNPTVGAYEFAAAAMPEFTAGYPQLQNITHSSVEAKVNLTDNGDAFALAKPSTEAAPSVSDVMTLGFAASNLAKNTDNIIAINQLISDTEYKAYFVLKSSTGELSEVIEGGVFTTLMQPTAVSTFEAITQPSGDFVDGTASFSGFQVVEITDGQGPNNHRAAKIVSSPATVTITNSSTGLVLNGFLFKSDAQVTMKAMRGTTEKATKTLATTDEKWVFISLRELDSITSITLTAQQGEAMIDDFSGLPQPITFMTEDTTVNQGTTLRLGSDIYGGVLPYTYSWTNAKQQVLSTTDSLVMVVDKTGTVTLTVTDAWGDHFAWTSLVTVIGEAEVATFDDLHLEPESHWRGDEASEEYIANSTFYSGSYAFGNLLMKSMDTWSFFGYSNRTATNYNPSNLLTDQFNSVVGRGVDNSENYAVVFPAAYMGITKLELTHTTEGDSVQGFFATNTAWVKYVSENGAGFNSTGNNDANLPFTTGDYLKLTATGDNGRSVDFYLVDYRDSVNTANHYLIETWQWVDLRPLGEVTSVTFTMDGSRKSTGFGTNIPTYFCMDNFGGERPVTEGEEIVLTLGNDSVLNLSTLFSTTATGGADTYYAITDSLNTTVATSTLAGSMLTVSPQAEGETSIVVSQTIKGERVFVKLPIKVEQPTGSSMAIQATEIVAYPNPATNGFQLNASGKVEIFTLTGKLVYHNAHYSAGDFIPTSAFEQGSYLVRIKGEILKVVVK